MMELIEDWKEINLGKSATLKARIGWQGLTTDEYLSSGDYFLVTGTDFLNGFIDWNNCVHVERERYDQDRNIQLQVDDILVTKDGTIGKVAIVDRILKPTTLNSGVFVVRPSGKSFYPKYLYYILRSGHFEYFLSRLTAGSTINHLYQKDFVHYVFPAPKSFEEQKAIAKVLTETDKLLQNLKTLIAKKKAIKQGAMQELLTGKKRLEGFSGEWEEKTLGEVTSSLVRGPFGGALKKEFFVKRGFKVYEQKNAIYKTILLGKYYVNNDKFKELKRFEVQPKDFIVSCSGTIGKIFQMPEKFEKGIINQALLKITLNDSIIDDSYFYFQFTSKPFQNKIIEDVQGGAMKNLVGMSVFKETKIEMPLDLKEQKAIAQILSDMDLEIEALENQLQKTENLKQGMMQNLLTGKVRLVKPTSKTAVKEDLSIAAEPKAVYKSTKPKNEHFTDAVLIGTMAKAYGSNDFPLTRFMYTKVSYLFKRYKEEQDNGYLKKAAGPYKPKTRYGGAEKIAFENKYIQKHISQYKGKTYENFLAGDNCNNAINYFKEWYGADSLKWIEQFKYIKRNQLELWATVDMAMQDLLKLNKLVNFETVKQLINEDKEWRPKLKRPIFSDENIEAAINKLNQLFN